MTVTTMPIINSWPRAPAIWSAVGSAAMDRQKVIRSLVSVPVTAGPETDALVGARADVGEQSVDHRVPGEYCVHPDEDGDQARRRRRSRRRS